MTCSQEKKRRPVGRLDSPVQADQFVEPSPETRRELYAVTRSDTASPSPDLAALSALNVTR